MYLTVQLSVDTNGEQVKNKIAMYAALSLNYQCISTEAKNKLKMCTLHHHQIQLEGFIR